MKKHLLLFIALGAGLLAVAGCQTSSNVSTTNTNDGAQSDTYAPMGSGVQHSISCTGIQETALPDGRLQVVANLHNKEERRLEVQAQCEFKDAQGFPVDSTPWVTVFLTERAVEGVKFISMNDKAKRYTVRVREAH